MGAIDVFIYGASGHGRVIADILRCSGHTVAGWIDDRELPDTLAWEKFRSLHPEGAIALGIGNNGDRERIFHQVRKAGYRLPVLIHPSAVISESATIAEGSVVMPLSVINAGAEIGMGCIINSGAVIEHDCMLGDFVHASPRSALAGGAKIGHGAHIGIGATVIQNITIGESAVVAAGSAVTHDVPGYSLAAGVPAAVKKSLFKPV